MGASTKQLHHQFALGMGILYLIKRREEQKKRSVGCSMTASMVTNLLRLWHHHMGCHHQSTARYSHNGVGGSSIVSGSPASKVSAINGDGRGYRAAHGMSAWAGRHPANGIVTNIYKVCAGA